MGKGESAMNRKLIRDALLTKYSKYIQKKGSLINTHAYVTANGEYYFHIVLPSETERDNTYDIVIHLYDPEKKLLGSASVRDYELHLFSNDPSFAYTHAYVYNQNGLLLTSLADDKLGKDFIKKAPVVRNRYQVVNYDKYLFFAVNYLSEERRISRVWLTTHATTFLQLIVYKKVRTLPTIMKEYQKAERQLRKEMKYEKEQTKEAKKKERKGPKTVKPIRGTNMHKVPKVPKHGSVKSRGVNNVKKK